MRSVALCHHFGVIRWLLTALMCLSLLACQTTPARKLAQTDTPLWQGRLALQVDDSAMHPFSASFALQGSASQGELNLYTPLGTTSAALRWQAHQASWQHDGRVQYFDHLSDLMMQALGAELPTDCLFQWLDGTSCQAPGWQVDLSAFEQGKIAAVRTSPTPVVRLRIQLD